MGAGILLPAWYHLILKRICCAGFKDMRLAMKRRLKSLQCIITGIVGRKKYMLGIDGVQIPNGLFKIVFRNFMPWRFSRPQII